MQQMSTRLASVNALTTSTTETRDRVRPSGRKDSLALTAVYIHAASESFLHEDERRWRSRVLVQRQDDDHCAPPGKGLRAGADARHHRPHARRAGRAIRHGAADGRSILLLAGKGPALRHHHRRIRRASRRSTTRPACTWPSRTSAVDWELWLPEQGEPLPKRFKVVQTQPDRPARDGRDVHGMGSRTADRPTRRSFPKVPADYEGIAVLQRAAAVKHMAAADPPPDPAAPATKK